MISLFNINIKNAVIPIYDSYLVKLRNNTCIGSAFNIKNEYCDIDIFDYNNKLNNDNFIAIIKHNKLDYILYIEPHED